MARLTALPSLDIIRGFRGILDFYIWRGLPCVRAWPRGKRLHRSDAEIASALLFGEIVKAYSLLGEGSLQAYQEMALGIPRTPRDIMVSGVFGNLHERTEVPPIMPATGVRVYRSVAQAIPHDAATTIVFDTQRWDDPDDDQWAPAPTPTRLTCQAAGLYIIAAHAIFDSHAAGIRWLSLQLNGGPYIASADQINLDPDWLALSVCTTYKLSVGDFLEVSLYQNSGGNLDIFALPNRSPEFSMVQITPP